MLEAGKLPQALKKAQLGIKKFPKDSDYHAIAGFVLTEMEKYQQSIPHFVEAARMKPDDPQFVENLANALMQTGQIDQALTYAEQKIEEFPNNKELTRLIEEITNKSKNWRSIINYTTQKLEKDPENADFLYKRARAFEHIGFVSDYTSDISRAYELAPDRISIAFLKAVNLHQSGDRAGSVEILKKILERDPTNPSALHHLAFMQRNEGGQKLLTAVEAALESKDYSSTPLEFAKAKLTSDHLGLSAALPLFARANAAQKQSSPYNLASEEDKFTRIIDRFPLGKPVPSYEARNNPTPIFVVGQPRSGTTLVEMMLSSTPRISGCGELMLASDLSDDFLDSGRAFDKMAAGEFARDYRRLMPPIRSDTVAFIDKMPHNFRRVGFLFSAFPNAKVVNLIRDPRDVGLSKWIRWFPAGGLRYTCDLEAIAHSANLYRRYMAHWDAVFGDRILTVQYENLVADPKTYSQQVADFCGIAWQESMMHPEENKKQVRTASIDQVRNKISTKSIGGWREVAEHIQPMLDGFDPALWPEYDFS